MTKPPRRTKVTAHRGFSARYPENTLTAFRAAVALGAERIELDVHESADGLLVVHHDYLLDRTTSGSGKVHATAWPELVLLDAGSWRGAEFAGARLPLLTEVLEEFADRVEYELELKGATAGFLERALAEVSGRGLLSLVEFTSPHLPLLMKLGEREPAARRGLFVRPFPDWMDEELATRLLIGDLQMGGFSVAHLPPTLLSEALVTALRVKGFSIHAADCNSYRELSRAFELQVDQLSTNEVAAALELRQRYRAANL